MIEIRRLTPQDADVVRAMFVYTFRWREDAPAAVVDDLLSEPAVALYIAGWPRDGDDGVVAVDAAGEAVGAAWYRRFDEHRPGYGFVSSSIPELGIAVVPGHRGHGVGRRLMNALIQLARTSGCEALSLSVEDGNVRAARLYEDLGFDRVCRVGSAWTMVRRTDSAVSAVSAGG